jgi:hypothetical protein
MKNNITRDTFDRTKQFSRVLFQQGRVQLDADFNEQASIFLDYLRTLTVDLVGPAAGPADNFGFALALDDKTDNISISPGRYYVDGLMVENAGPTPFAKTITDIRSGNKPVAVYLDVWERLITAIEDDLIREKALGGPDTASRAKVEWAVRPLLGGEINLETSPTTKLKSARSQFQDWIEKRRATRPLLRADLMKEEPNDDPCACSPDPGYRGFENELYRVEIHRPGSGVYAPGKSSKDTATFKWSRNNGADVAAWSDADDGVLQVAAARDRARGFVAGQWVELTDESNDLEGRPGTLVQLKSVSAGSLTLDPKSAPGAPLGLDKFNGKYPKVRRWDQEENEDILLDEGAVAIEYDKWYALEDGLQVLFPAPAPADGQPGQYEFRSGDYWLIPARVATRDIEWSAQDRTNGRRPDGVDHHYALLGLLEPGADDKFSFTDMRQKFARLPLNP